MARPSRFSAEEKRSIVTEYKAGATMTKIAEKYVHKGDKLYIEAICEAGGSRTTAIIATGHTNFVYEERDGIISLDRRDGCTEEAEKGISKTDGSCKYKSSVYVFVG